jgi:hypothetical protein
MTHSITRFIAAALLSSAATGSMAETVYRCGNVYSQSPCASARTIEVDDARSAADRDEAHRIARSERQLGDSMERNRLAAEAALRPATATSIGPAAQRSIAVKPVAKRRLSKARQVDGFVAVDPTTLKHRRSS